MTARRECRYTALGPLYLMACVDGWCMVRRPRAVPFVIAETEWRILPTEPPGPPG